MSKSSKSDGSVFWKIVCAGFVGIVLTIMAYSAHIKLRALGLFLVNARIFWV